MAWDDVNKEWWIDDLAGAAWRPRDGVDLPHGAYHAINKRAYDLLKEELATAVRYLREGKAQFTPTTTNSHVDEFIKKHECLKT